MEKKTVPRVFCWIMTTSLYRQSRTIYLEDTWPKRCDRYMFFTDNATDLDESFHKTIFANLNEGHENLWEKTKAAMQYIYENLVNDFDYFLKADDDTYIVVENLRQFLAPFNGSDHHYFGYKWSHELRHGHASGGAGYVLSRSTLKLLVESLSNTTICPAILANATNEIAEDLQVGRCLENLDIFLEPTADPKGLQKFLPLHPNLFNLLGKTGEESISSDVIGIHYLSPTEYRLIDFFLYRFRMANPNERRKLR
uniref:N-acetylgalactosaminide beta-1,3-galactosyltransferase n=1 Tax=Plectus sambesii TaxID=2011161 RepID=A0A914V1D1_9BILA